MCGQQYLSCEMTTLTLESRRPSELELRRSDISSLLSSLCPQARSFTTRRTNEQKLLTYAVHNKEHVLHTPLHGTTEISYHLIGLDVIISFSVLGTIQVSNATLLFE